MLYDPINNLPYPCDTKAKPKKRDVVGMKQRLREFLVKRADGDSIPIKLPPCPSTDGIQEHRWSKS